MHTAPDVHLAGGDHFDVVVVGARCAGAATATLLAREGARVALLDRAALGRDTLSTHALMRAGVVQLRRWGLLDQVIAAGTPAVHRTVFRYGEASTTVTLKPYAGVDALYAPRRTVLDPILVAAAREAGAHVVFGAAVTGVSTGHDGRVTGVVGHDANGEPLRLRATVTVGADGMHSRVARAVAAPLERLGTHASGFIYGHVPRLEADSYEWFYAPGVTAGVIPTNAGEACVWVGAPPHRFRAELADDITGSFHRLLAEMSPDLAARVAAAPAPSQLRSFPGMPGFLRRPWGPGWALVGDAGYFKDPCTAHGMTDALRDAELLARAITAMLGRQLPEAIAMHDYHQTRNRLSTGLFEVTDQIASYQWDTISVERHLRALSAAMSDEVEFLASLDVPDAARLAG